MPCGEFLVRICYLSRGHGYGHAATDLEIVGALRSLVPDLSLELASYGTGLSFFASRGVPCVDLGIDDVEDQSLDAALRVMAFLRRQESVDLVVGHEMFSMPRMASMLGLRNVLLTHWFFSEIGEPARDVLLEQADRVVLLDFPAAHVPPASVRAEFAGALAPSYAVSRSDARLALGIPAGAFVVVVATGAVTSVNDAHLRSVVSLGVAAARIGGADPLIVMSGIEPAPRIAWVPWTDSPELYHRAADMVIANATFATLSALARNGVPTVAITGGRNPVDRLHADFFASAGLLATVEVGAAAEEVWSAAEKAASLAPARLPWASPEDVARLLLTPPVHD